MKRLLAPALAPLFVIVAIFELAAAAAAWAEEPTGSTVLAGATPPRPLSAASRPAPSPAALPWSVPSGRGVGIGVDVFGSATSLEWDASALVPISGLFALRARLILYRELGGADLALGGKLEAIVRSPVLMNFVRVYAGGGPALFYDISGPDAGQVDGNWFAGDINGNWLAGLEVFFAPRASAHWEVGTSGGAFGSGAGAYADVGLTVYLQ